MGCIRRICGERKAARKDRYGLAKDIDYRALLIHSTVRERPSEKGVCA